MTAGDAAAVPDLYEVVLVDGADRWSAGWVVDEDSDKLLTVGGKVVVFSGRAALEHYGQQHGFTVLDDLPDELDLDLGGWLSQGNAPPPEAEVSELWHLLLDHPTAGRPLQGDEIEEAYDDLVEEVPDFYTQHGQAAREALARAVALLRASLTQV
ncbi:MAG: hypothetical protein M3N21_02510 [Actinomycetota bacterium]|nr:hypothetical protein [Actinomycetota bacterium]